MYTTNDYLGFAAAVCTTSAFIPQAFKIWKCRVAKDVSSGMYIILIIGSALWLAYGIALLAWPLILANSITLLFATSILTMKSYFDWKR